MNYYEKLQTFCLVLQEEERSKNTIDKYLRDIRKFLEFNESKIIKKETIIFYKEYLIEKYSPRSVNSIIAAINKFLDYINLADLKIKPLKIQREIFSSEEKELSQKDYLRLIETAEKKGKHKLSLIIQTICSTGIRVSELQYICFESLSHGRVEVRLKGKNRLVFISKELRKALKEYCKKEKIKSGIIFRTKNFKPLDRTNIWKMMKQICKKANVNAEKVFPHNLRHLFARTYYKIHKDISRLADILGHSNINTTRMYTMESGSFHQIQVERLNLIYKKSTT